MTAPILRENPSAVEPLVRELIERATDFPELTAGHLMERMTELLGQEVVVSSSDARAMLERKLTQISARMREEPLGVDERRFYNLSCDLVDAAGRINHWCLQHLEGICLQEGPQDDAALREYQIGARERQACGRIQGFLEVFDYERAARLF